LYTKKKGRGRRRTAASKLDGWIEERIGENTSGGTLWIVFAYI